MTKAQLSFEFEEVAVIDTFDLESELNRIIKECRKQRRSDRSDLGRVKDFVISRSYHDIWCGWQIDVICLLDDKTTCHVWLLEKRIAERTFEMDMVHNVVRKKFRDWRSDGMFKQSEMTFEDWLEHHFDNCIEKNGLKFSDDRAIEMYEEWRRSM